MSSAAIGAVSPSNRIANVFSFDKNMKLFIIRDHFWKYIFLICKYFVNITLFPPFLSCNDHIFSLLLVTMNFCMRFFQLQGCGH